MFWHLLIWILVQYCHDELYQMLGWVQYLFPRPAFFFSSTWTFARIWLRSKLFWLHVWGVDSLCTGTILQGFFCLLNVTLSLFFPSNCFTGLGSVRPSSLTNCWFILLKCWKILWQFPQWTQSNCLFSSVKPGSQLAFLYNKWWLIFQDF